MRRFALLFMFGGFFADAGTTWAVLHHVGISEGFFLTQSLIEATGIVAVALILTFALKSVAVMCALQIENLPFATSFTTNALNLGFFCVGLASWYFAIHNVMLAL